MDGLSAAASIVSIIQITGSALRFCNAVRRQPSDLNDIVEQLESLKTVLGRLNDLQIRSPSGSLPELSKLYSGPLPECQRDVQELYSRLQTSLGANGFRGLAKRMTWPKERKGIDHILANLEQSKVLFILALSTDHAQQGNDIKRTLRAMGHRGDSDKINNRHEAALRWLNTGLDPFQAQRKAWKKHQPSTGDWLICGQQYNEWKKTGQSKLLWLHGIPGCGKTILCSIVIKSLTIETQQHSRRALAYFYYDFNLEAGKRDCIAMLRSIVGQLASQIEGDPPHVRDLYTVCAAGSRLPDEQQLCLTLSNIIRDFDQTFIIIDALDESSDRGEFPDILTTAANIHVLVTSRFMDDVEYALRPFRPMEVLANAHVDDIRTHVKSRLQHDNKLNRLSDVIKARIEEALVETSGGMFRWVECQLDSLGGCRTEKSIVETLASLPATLDETYSRILQGIGEGDREYAVTALRWMAFSARPLHLHELAEVLSIRLGTSSIDDLLSPTDVLPRSLDAIQTAYKALIRSPYTLKELLADEAACQSSISASSVLKPSAKYFRADATKAALARVAMMYKAKLLDYSATHWVAHIQRVAPSDLHDMTDCIIDFLSCDAAYSNWVSALELTTPVEDRAIHLHGIPTSVPSSLTLALLLGLTEVACSLITRKPIRRLAMATDLDEVNNLRCYLNKAPRSTALTATDRKIVRRLASSCSWGDNTIQRLPHIDIVNLMEVLLLIDSVDILSFFAETSDYLNISGDLVSVLPCAFEIGSDSAINSLLRSQRVVEVLSTTRTDVPFIKKWIRIRAVTEKPLFMIALEARQPAAFKSFLQYYDKQDDLLRDTLKMAIERSDEETVAMLLDAGIDPWDRRDSLNWNPLETAVKFESLSILESLMGVKDRCTNFADSDYGGALLYAIKHCEQEFVKLLVAAKPPKLSTETDPRPEHINIPNKDLLRSALEQRRLDGLFGVDHVQQLLEHYSILPSSAKSIDTSLSHRKRRGHGISRIGRAPRLPVRGQALTSPRSYYQTAANYSAKPFHSQGPLFDRLCNSGELNFLCLGEHTSDAGQDRNNDPIDSSRSSCQTLSDDTTSYHTRDTSLSYLTELDDSGIDAGSRSTHETDLETYDNKAKEYLLNTD